VEKRWEVRGQGQFVSILGHDQWIYPMCKAPSPGYHLYVAVLLLDREGLSQGSGTYKE
jgi:hypothetical protein